jgi:hypothetical protein
MMDMMDTMDTMDTLDTMGVMDTMMGMVAWPQFEHRCRSPRFLPGRSRPSRETSAAGDMMGSDPFGGTGED